MEIEKEKDFADAATSYFQWALEYRKVTLKELADVTGANYSTLSSYSCGRVSIRNAKAGLVFEIAEYLKIDPRLLVGIGYIDYSRGLDEYIHCITLEEVFEQSSDNRPYRPFFDKGLDDLI